MSAALVEPHAGEVMPQSQPGRLGTMPLNQIKSLIGPPRSRRFGKAAKLVPAIRYWEGEFAKLSDEDLKKKAHRVRGRARGGESLDKLLPEAFGLVCVASVRTLNMRPFDVQLCGGAVMHFSALAELATGEGKTLTASLPVFLNALTGKGVHVTTVNDYLAKRDAELIGPLYSMLG